MQKILSTVIKHPITDCTLYAVESDEELKILELKFGAHVLNHRTVYDRLASYKKMILDYLNGLDTELSVIPVDLCRYTSFQKTILNATIRIPRGTTMTYEEIACRSGFPGAARAVGSVLRKNVFPLIIPCHRVVLKSGKTGGFCGKQQGNFAELKRKLLKLESCQNRFI